MGRLASVGRCVAVVVYGLAVIAATAYAWDYVVDRSRFADYLQGARDIAYDERRGRLVVSALHADSVAVLDARGEDIALSGLYVDHERFGNAHGFAYDADRELVFAASYTKHSLAALDVGAPRRGGAVVGWVEDGVALQRKPRPSSRWSSTCPRARRRAPSSPSARRTAAWSRSASQIPPRRS